MATIQGTAGDDSLLGTAQADVFQMQDGGADNVAGAEGDDTFNFGASLDSADRIGGGVGTDTLVLDGDYSAGLALGDIVTGVEMVRVAAGHSYSLEGFSRFTGLWKIDGSGLGADDRLTVDAQGTLEISLLGGAGADSLTGGIAADSISGGDGDNFLRGGDGDDTISAGTGHSTIGASDGDDLIGLGHGVYKVQAGAGGDTIDVETLDPKDRLNGGEGGDVLGLGRAFTSGTYHFNGKVLEGFESILVFSQATITTADSLLDTGQVLNLVVLDQSASNNLNFDGSRERDGGFNITGTGHDDLLIGGQGDDTLDGIGRRDVIQGNGGRDVMSGGHAFRKQAGSVFIFAAVTDSTVERPDEIQDLGDDQRIDLHRIDARVDKAGDQAFKLVEAFTGHSGQLMLTYDGGADVTYVAGDVDGDGVADFRIILDGDHLSFSHFSL